GRETARSGVAEERSAGARGQRSRRAGLVGDEGEDVAGREVAFLVLPEDGVRDLARRDLQALARDERGERLTGEGVAGDDLDADGLHATKKNGRVPIPLPAQVGWRLHADRDRDAAPGDPRPTRQ